LPESQILAVIFAVGIASYAMRAGGFLAASALPQGGALPRLLRLAPGNLLVAFVAAGILEGGWPCVAGCIVAAATMAITKQQWAALGLGFGAAALASAML
jgi:uncharacterized membrane protein